MTAVTGTKTKAIRPAVAALKRAGVAADQIEAGLRGMGLDVVAAEERAARATQGAAKTVSSEAQVKAARPGVYRVTGAGVSRLYLKKTSSDAGSYFLRYRVDGRRPGMGLGAIADVSLAAAKALAIEIGAQLGKRTDPLAERRAERIAARAEEEEAARQAATPTVEAAIMTYLEAVAPSWRHPYARTNWLNPIRTYALPVIGQLKVDAVEPRHILAVMTAMDEANVPVLAGKVRSRLKTVFDYLAAHGLRSPLLSNPADAGVIGAGRPKTETATEHYRRLPGGLDAAPDTFRRLMALAPDNVATAAWAWMILTAARPGEALAARWGQIDRDKGLWLNPAPKTKKSKKAKAGAKAETADALPVPLSSLALRILDVAARWRVGDLVFPGRGDAKLVYTTFATALNKAGVGIDAGSPHSWRSIFADAAADRLGVARETREAALGHSLGAVEGAYRRETGVEARRLAMQAYANWLMDEKVNVVVPFKGRA
jgi:integrase